MAVVSKICKLLRGVYLWHSILKKDGFHAHLQVVYVVAIKSWSWDLPVEHWRISFISPWKTIGIGDVRKVCKLVETAARHQLALPQKTN